MKQRQQTSLVLRQTRWYCGAAVKIMCRTQAMATCRGVIDVWVCFFHVRPFHGLSASLPLALDNKLIMGMVLPAIRCDFALLDDYYSRQLVTSAPLPGIPVRVMFASDDPRVERDTAARWEEVTTGPTVLKTFERGGHFYLADAELAEPVLRSVLEQVREILT